MHKYVRRTLAFSLIMVWLITSCSYLSDKNQGGTKQFTIPDTTMTAIGIYPPPITNDVTHITLTFIPEYPYPLISTPIPTYPKCEEDYHNDAATSTPTPSGWYVKSPTILTSDEVGDAGTEDIIKLILKKYFEQFMTPEAEYLQIKDYAIVNVLITNVIQCRGPNQLENIYGQLTYSVKPAVDIERSLWYAGDASLQENSWINHGTHFLLIKTKYYYELQLLGNG